MLPSAPFSPGSRIREPTTIRGTSVPWLSPQYIQRSSPGAILQSSSLTGPCTAALTEVSFHSFLASGYRPESGSASIRPLSSAIRDTVRR